MINTITDTLKNILGFTKQKEVKCTIDDLEAPLFECGPGHLTQGYGFFGYTGVPAPAILPDDPWFGPSPVKSEKQKQIVPQDIVVNMDGGVGGSWKINPEPENIHEVMYEMATKNAPTTIQLDPVGGSENFMGGSENIHS
tara:strand:- start:758 stop:1177 length:420 start_codon:yes stop_codon:yes gene_type:complete